MGTALGARHTDKSAVKQQKWRQFMKTYFLVALIATMLACGGSSALAASDSGENASASGVFSAMDDNGDGMVSKSEFTEYYTASMQSRTYDTREPAETGWFGEDAVDPRDQDAQHQIRQGGEK